MGLSDTGIPVLPDERHSQTTKERRIPCAAQVLWSTVGRAWQLMVPVVILQTVAVNLASTLTPIGNPKSL